MHRAPRRCLQGALVVFAAIACPDPASAAWSPSPNLNTPIGVQLDAARPLLLADGAGGVFVTWTQFTASTYVLRMQRLDRNGDPLWAAGGIAVASPPTGLGVPTALVSDGAGGAIVCFADQRNDPNTLDTFVQRVSGDGIPQWTAGGVNVAPLAGSQAANFGAVEDGAGGVIVAWIDERPGATVADVYAQRFSALGVAQWTANGNAVCTAAGEQQDLQIVSDGQGGVIIAWEDERTAPQDIYAQRLSASGSKYWAGDGVPVVTAAGEQNSMVLAGDGASGAYVAWSDYRHGPTSRLYAQHLTSAGTPAWAADGVQVGPDLSAGVPTHAIPDGAGGAIVVWDDFRGADQDVYVQRIDAGGAEIWAADGLLVGGATINQYEGWLTPDGHGGAMVFFTDDRTGESDIYSQHVTADGTALWAINGLKTCSAPGNQYGARATSDGRGGAILAWNDERSGETDVYAQRVAPFGVLGNPEPRIQSVLDVAADQGGAVRVAWTGSFLDVIPSGPVDEYRLWREVPVSAAEAALARGVRLVAAGAALPAGLEPGARLLRTSSAAGATWYWELEAVQPAAGFAGYSKTAATGAVSSPPTLHYARYMVEARESATRYHWDSFPDSGYSTDDLAPPAPTPFSGVYSGATTSLGWGPSAASDVASYHLYRGAGPDFTPTETNRIATPTGTAFVDPIGALFWYKVAAVDVHGNEGPATATLPTGTVAVDTSLPETVWLGPASPNPSAGRAVFRFALPAAAEIELTLFDQQGRRVRALAAGAFAAGRHEIQWDGRGEFGRALGSGVYLYRLRAAGVERTGSIVVIR